MWQLWSKRGCGTKRNLKPFCRTILHRRNSKRHFRGLPRKWNWSLWSSHGNISKNCKHLLIIAKSSIPKIIMILIWTLMQNWPSRSGKSTLRGTFGDIREKTVPEQKSGWISNLNGLDIIGLFLRCILAARDLSWISVCVPPQRTFASLWKSGIYTPTMIPAYTLRRSSKCK